MRDDIFCSYCHFHLPEYPTPDDSWSADDTTLTSGLSSNALVRPNHVRRNTVVAVVIAAVVAITAIGVLHNTTQDSPAATPGLPVLTNEPSALWTAHLEWPVLAMANDSSSIFTLTGIDGRFAAQSFDASTGAESWATEFDLTDRYSFDVETSASLAMVDGDLAAVIEPIGFVVVFDAGDGSTMWTDVVGASGSWLAADGILVSGSIDGTRVQRIDVPAGELTPTISNVFAVDDRGRVFVDRDGALTINDDESDTPFRFEHSDVLESLIPLADGTYVASLHPPSSTMTGYDAMYPQSDSGANQEPVVTSGEFVLPSTLVGLDATGAELWTYDLDYGMGEILPMSDNRLLVPVGSGSQILSLDTPPRPITDARRYERVIVGPGPDGRDVVYGVQGQSSGGDTVIWIVDEADGRFRTVADIDGFASPRIIPNGEIAYLTTGPDGSFSGGTAGVHEIAAVATRTGDILWRLQLERSLLTWTDTGFAVVTSADEPTLTFYGH